MILEHIGFVLQQIPLLVKIKLFLKISRKKIAENHEQVILK